MAEPLLFVWGIVDEPVPDERLPRRPRWLPDSGAIVTGSVTAAIEADFSAAAAAQETVPAAVIASVTDDFGAALVVTAGELLALSVAVDVTADFAASAAVVSADPVTTSVATDITPDIVAALSVSSVADIDATVVATIASEVSAQILARVGALFIPPGITDTSRIAVVPAAAGARVAVVH